MQLLIMFVMLAGIWATLSVSDNVADISLLQQGLEIEQQLRRATVESPPDVVIFGIGDSGTRRVKAMMNHLGIQMCTTNEDPIENNILTMPVHELIPELLEAANGSFTEDAYMTSGVFDEAVDLERRGAEDTYSCILANMGLAHALMRPDGIKWGYKNPQHIYLRPVIDAAFDAHQNMLIVARDPRDICTAYNRGQQRAYVEIVLGEEFDNSYSSGLSQCLRFLGSVWESVLRDFEDAENVLIVRIEDLVLPDPKVSNTSQQVLLHMMEFAANISPTVEEIQAELEVAHSYKDSYMGHHYGMPEYQRKGMEKITSAIVTTSEVVSDMMSALGYHPDHYGLVEPRHALVYAP